MVPLAEPGRIAVDIGSSTVTGIASTAVPGATDSTRCVGHPVMDTLALNRDDLASLGSDTARVGFLFSPPPHDGSPFRDPLGVTWIWEAGGAVPVHHPLENVDPRTAPRPAPPAWPSIVQALDTGPGSPSAALVVLDAPCPGLLETCFAMRGHWAFLADLADDWRAATVLLEWSLVMVSEAYERLLASLPAPPDLIILGDDYGSSHGMFLSPTDFRTRIRPRLRDLIAHLRRLAGSTIVVHSCGSIAPILPDLADLGVDALNLEAAADGMDIASVRAALPGSMILHGYTDLTEVGHAVANGDTERAARLAAELLTAGPTIAAPADTITTRADLVAAVRGVAFVRALAANAGDAHAIGEPRSPPFRRAIEWALAASVPTHLGAGRPAVTTALSGQARQRVHVP